MERFHLSKKDSSHNGSQLSNASHNGSTTNKKWSFGRLFRRKKEVETESSSEEDRKAGFLPAQKFSRSANSSASAAITSTPNKKAKSAKSSSSRGSKLMSENFDRVIVAPTGTNISPNYGYSGQHHVDNEFFLPVEAVPAVPEPYYQNNDAHQTQHRLHHSQQYLPHVPKTQQQLMSRSAHSLDRRSARAKQRSQQKMITNGLPNTAAIVGSSSEEEIISLNSTTFSKYRSDESIHSGGQSYASGQSRRSRAARNERYYKRLSRDGEVSHGQVPVMHAQQPTQRWKTQPVPLSIYQAPKQQVTPLQQPQPQVRASGAQNSQYSKLRNTNSLQHMAPYVQWGQMQQQQQSKNLQNSVNDTKRSISYDSHIHLQNANGRMQNKPMPPPPPPRDPLRRVNISGHLQDGSSSDLRPISYAFDQTGVPVLPATGLSGRCVSDDKIWAQQPHYQSIHSLNITPNQSSQSNSAVGQNNRRFITRAERDAQPGKKSLPNGLEFHYVADATPRSRKPIHMLDPKTFEDDPQEPPSSGILRTTKSGLPTSPTKVKATEFWKRLEGSSHNINNPTPAPRGRDVQRSVVASNNAIKPRSVSTSRVGEMRAYPVPMYSEVYKPKNKAATLGNTTSQSAAGGDEVDGVICGRLHIKPSQDNSSNYVEVRNKDANKAQSMPNNYQRHSEEIPTTPNKYEEYVNERREKHHNPLFDAPQPPQRKLSGVPQIPQLSFPRKKPANLEEAINELEAIYRSLGLTEETETKKERVATPNDFDNYALTHAAEYDEEDSPTGEPDPVKDDVAYRNIKLANLQHKTVEKQPPFGIPVGPIMPAAHSDYLHVTPKRKDLSVYATEAPDVVKDDLAVRALRKDPGENAPKFQYPTGSLVKKNRATRTQSANIYALIQRDAAKPSGGDLHSYLELTKSIDRSGSMSDIHKHDATSDIPTTLKLLQNLREQEREQNQMQHKKVHIPFRHPSQGGAICQLPEKLSSCSNNHEEEKRTKPVPLPRKSLTPEPKHTDTHKMEEALNKIAQEAQESSIKLTQELKELRKEALITACKPNKKVTSEDEKLEKELKEIEKVSQAAKKCGEMLLDTLPDAAVEQEDEYIKARKLHKEDKLIKAIDQVSEAANKVCEKILKDIVTTEPPVVVQEAVKVTQKPTSVNEVQDDNLVMPILIKKLDPIQSTNIEAIARRCMRQLSDLADNHDYDNLQPPDIAVASTCNMQQVTKDETTNDLNTSNLTEIGKPPNKPPTTNNNKHTKQIEEIDQIMRECEDQAKQNQVLKAAKGKAVVVTQHVIKAPGSSTTASSFSSSSDCLAKSSSPSGSRRFSSSITSFNPYSSSDYIKSPSSDFHAPSTDPIKTFSTSSYDVQSTASATPNQTTISTFSYSPSPPPLNLTPVSNCSATIASNTQRGLSSSPSQYNSSEELAMIFGIEEKAKAQKLQNNSGNEDATPELLLPEQENSKTNAASLPECTANSITDPYECCAKTNDYPLFLTPNSSSQTNTASSSPISATSNSSSSTSSSLFRLKTIAELQSDKGSKSSAEGSENPKLASNLNRVYASKLKILVEKMGEVEPPILTQFGSLSSLEETSSNPDSGNVSLADFPLGCHNVNNSLQLNPNFNSRYEIRNCFKTEITLDGMKTNGKTELNVQEEEKEFPRLPTAEELEESLRERYSLEDNFRKTEEILRGQNNLKEKLALTKEDRETIGEKIIWARDEIMAEVKALENKVNQEKQLKAKEEVNANFKQTPIRKRSIVMETPQLEMSILEEKVQYEFNVKTEVGGNTKAEKQELKELTENCKDLKQNHEQDTDSHKDNELRLRLWQPTVTNLDEVPTTSSKALTNDNNTITAVVNVLGEQRTAVNSLTLLEHLVVACTLGVISTDDLFTLCLIIIGIIIVIAIALF